MKTIEIKNVSQINKHETNEGIALEEAIERMLENGEPFGEEVTKIYTERKEGVQPGYDIRTDRFEVALTAIDSVNKSYKARRENLVKKDDIIEDESTQTNLEK